MEVPLNDRFIVTGVLSHTRALNEDSTADALGIVEGANRSDRRGGVHRHVVDRALWKRRPHDLHPGCERGVDHAERRPVGQLRADAHRPALTRP